MKSGQPEEKDFLFVCFYLIFIGVWLIYNVERFVCLFVCFLSLGPFGEYDESCKPS